MFKGLGSLASMMRQAPVMLGKMQAMNDDLKQRRAKAQSGGGMVEIEINGLGEVQRVTLDPTLVARGDAEMMEDLLVSAFNQAQQRANELRSEAMQNMADGLDIPGLGDALAQVSNPPSADE